MKLENAVRQMYKGRDRIIILGLTGRTGVGCSTVARILEKKNFKELELRDSKSYGYHDIEERKYHVYYNYMRDQGWKPFDVIEISSVILVLALSRGLEAFKDYIYRITDENSKNILSIGDKENVILSLERVEYMFKESEKYVIDDRIEKAINDKTLENIDEYYDFYMNKAKQYKKSFKEMLSEFSCFEIQTDEKRGKHLTQYHLYTYLLQQMGNNLRCSGDPYNNKFSADKYREFIKRIDAVIKIIMKYDEDHKDRTNDEATTRICIDAIRNPYEALYLKDKYKAFYLISVNADDADRIKRLDYLNKEEQENLDNIEFANKLSEPKEKFYHQNISECMQIADIHIYNPNIRNHKYYQLTGQIVKYIALFLHPGLVTPSNIERCMQLAFTAKLNSGCLSRQVGAVVTRDDFSVQSIGWNDVPKGQITCNLRNAHEYCRNKDSESYSKYELENSTFSDAIKRIDNLTSDKAKGLCKPYCFKDVYNTIKGEKNQVYTRALHAEENAFLQISKYGGSKINGGFLFSSASPCELCAKKAYQLGIKEIYYIDPYPGISQDHILSFGNNNNPKMKLFYGAIGQAYIDFYEPKMAFKDELEMMTGVNVKEAVKNEIKEEELSYKDIVFDEVNVLLSFEGSRFNMKCERSVKATAGKDGIKKISKKIFWTGSTYNSTSMIKENSDEYLSLDEDIISRPYKYDVLINKDIKKGQKIKYSLLTVVKDEKGIMEPYLAHMVDHETKRLKLAIRAPKELVSKVSICIYADHEMKTKIFQEQIREEIENDMVIYKYKKTKANVNYTYAIEWEFTK